MKNIIIFPPLSHPAYPYLSSPLLVGQLRNADFDAETYDYNLEYFNTIFTKEYVKNVIYELNNFINYPKDDLNIKKIMQLKEQKIKAYLDKNHKQLYLIEKYIEQATEIIRSEEFYNPKAFINAYRIIKYAMELFSVHSYPMEISLGDYHNDFYNLNWNDIKFQTSCNEVNPFIKFYEDTIDNILSKKPKFIGISVTFDRQIVPAFTLAKILKQRTSAHITMGGNLIGRIEKTIKKYPEILKDYADSIMCGDGERSIVSLVQAIKNRTSFENVKGLIYTGKDNLIHYNDIEIIKDVNSISNLDLSGIKLNKYLTPEITLPFQLSKGCYWGKCTFCDYFHGRPAYYRKTAQRVVDEICEIINKFGIKTFEFVDEAIPPKYYEEIADELIRRKVDIKYYSMVRLEKGFTKELFEKLYKSGLRMLDWGFESASERIMKMMNKGIDVSGRYQILENSAKAGIWNHLFIMFGFPTETKSELEQTIRFLENRKDIVDSFTSSVFALRKYSKINQNLEKFKIKDKIETQDCSIEYSFTDDCKTIRNKEDVLKIFDENFLKEDVLSSIYFYLIENYLLLYLLKYGRENVKKIKINS